MMAKFTPKPVDEPTEQARPTSAELQAAIGPLTDKLIRTSPPEPQQPVAQREPSVTMSFKASKPFAKLLTELAEQEGGLRKVIARVLAEAGHAVPQRDLNPQRPRRSFD